MVGVLFYTYECKQWLHGKIVHSKKFKVPKHERLVKYTWAVDGLDYIEPISADLIITKNNLLVFVKDGLDTIGFWYKAVLIDRKKRLYQYTYSDGQVWEQQFSPAEIVPPDGTKLSGSRNTPIQSGLHTPKTPLSKVKTLTSSPNHQARPESAKDTNASIELSKIELVTEKFLAAIPAGENFNLLNELTRTFFKNKYRIEEAFTIKNESQTNFRMDRSIRYVFHGTPTITPIVKNGFDCTRAKTCLFGQGLYFSENPRISLGYSSSSYIIVAQIAEPSEPKRSAKMTSRSQEDCAFNHIHWICKDSHCCIPKYLIKLQAI